MTTFKCRTCGITWQMGPTRDMDPNEQCHCCAKEGNGILNARVAELEAGLNQIHHLAAHAPGAGQASTMALIEKVASKALKN